ncbi:unnamed protein product [Brassica napus]|uniref:(rape) hypothetical protein n=1 Tax=Brassica napus TaxID=3708 RepID=A0A816WM50_BRANA|nr:unnamed protein product [Brassica napus]
MVTCSKKKKLKKCRKSNSDEIPQHGDYQEIACEIVCFIGRTKPCKRQYCYFFSSSSSSTTFLSRVKCPREDPECFPCLPHYANGLIRLGYGEKKLICNPSTGAEYLCLMKFDLRYEKWDLLTRLSSDMSRLGEDCTLINYEGKVAITTTNTSGDTFNVWVIDQAAREPGWLKKSFSIESWKFLSKLSIYGSTHTGEFILAPRYYSHDFSGILYNPNTNGLRKIKVDVKGSDEFKHGRRMRTMVFWEYFQSIRLL